VTVPLRHRLEEEDYRGERYANHHKELKGNNDLLVITKPQVGCWLTSNHLWQHHMGCACDCADHPLS
jgi:methionine synthase I (cobalamin-dependent)